MQRKNHDYGEAWRSMRVSSLVDLILMKLLRIKSIEDKQGDTLVSRGHRRELPRHRELWRVLRPDPHG